MKRTQCLRKKMPENIAEVIVTNTWRTINELILNEHFEHKEMKTA